MGNVTAGNKIGMQQRVEKFLQLRHRESEVLAGDAALLETRTFTRDSLRRARTHSRGGMFRKRSSSVNQKLCVSLRRAAR